LDVKLLNEKQNLVIVFIIEITSSSSFSFLSWPFPCLFWQEVLSNELG